MTDQEPAVHLELERPTEIRLKPGDVIDAKVGDDPVKLTVVEVGTSDDSPEDALRRYRLARGGA